MGFLFMFFFLKTAFPQDQDTIDSIKQRHKNNIHSITYEPFMSFQYVYLHSWNKHLGLGIAAQFGTGIHFFLYHPYYFSDYGRPNKELQSSTLAYNLELLKLSLLYRDYLSAKVYLEIELFYAFGEAYKERYEFNKMYGLTLSMYWGFDKVKFGHEIIIGKMQIERFVPSPYNPSVLLVPVSVRFEF